MASRAKAKAKGRGGVRKAAKKAISGRKAASKGRGRGSGSP